VAAPGTKFRSLADPRVSAEGEPLGAVVNTAQAYRAASTWRDEVLKPMIDIYGQELSLTAYPEPLGKPLADGSVDWKKKRNLCR
jgi:hypothetical protein